MKFWSSTSFTQAREEPRLSTTRQDDKRPIVATTPQVLPRVASGSGATRVTISQTYFREDPLHLFTASSLRGLLDRDGFFDHEKMTFIVVEGQQEWAATEISRPTLGLGTPDRLWSRDDSRPIMLPRICDTGGLYTELDMPSPAKDPAKPTRIRIYVHLRQPRSPTPSHSERLQYTYYRPRLVFVIVSPTPLLKSATISLSEQLKRYYRSANQLRVDRLSQNPAWIVMDVLNATSGGGTDGTSWIDCLGSGPSWDFIFPPAQPPLRKMPLIPFHNRIQEGDNYQPADIPEKMYKLHRYTEACLRVKEHIMAQKMVLEGVLALLPSMELGHQPASSTVGASRRRSSKGSMEDIIAEEEIGYAYSAGMSHGKGLVISGGTGPSAHNSRYGSFSGSVPALLESPMQAYTGASSQPPAPPPPPPLPRVSNQQHQQNYTEKPLPTIHQHISFASSQDPPSHTNPPLPRYGGLPAHITTQLTTLTHHLHHLSHLSNQTHNLITYLNASTRIAHRASGRTVAAVAVVVGPLAFLALVVALIGGVGPSGSGNVDATAGWVYPVIAVPVVIVLGVLVGLVRRLGI